MDDGADDNDGRNNGGGVEEGTAVDEVTAERAMLNDMVARNRSELEFLEVCVSKPSDWGR